jgi:acyl-CoA synthetase (AMP-forming)/AMP-acid ligase II
MPDNLTMSYDERPWLKSYDEGLAPDVHILEMTLTEWFDDVLNLFPERPALHFFGKRLTYRTLMDHADRVAQALADGGCHKGDVVCIHLPNIPQYMITQIGALRAGCAASGLSPLSTPTELSYQLNDSKAKALVTLDVLYEHRLSHIADKLPHLKVIFVTGILDFLPRYKRILARLLKKVPTGKIIPNKGKQVVPFMKILARYPVQQIANDLTPEDTCLVQYTGGTTGIPKGAVLTHRNLVANLSQMIEWTKPERGREIALSGFPFFHLAGLMIGLLTVSLGGAQVLIPDPRDTKHIIKEMVRYRPTVLVNVPSLYLMLLEEPAFRRLDFTRVKFCISGAAPFPVEGIRELERVVGENKLIEVYGMTETSPIITMNPYRGTKKIGTVGIPVQGTRVRLVDLETGTREVPLQEEGELIVHGPQVMKGYLNRPEETQIALRTMQGERWLFTGDVAKMDEDGYFTIVDRSKDMLNVGGFKVFSREVEESIIAHPAIVLCAVIGVPNPKRPGSELVKLVVQLHKAYHEKDQESIKEELILFARSRLSPYKVPKLVSFVKELPLTPVGKVDKKSLREVFYRTKSTY